MPPFLVSIHDATPAHARETRAMLHDLAPLVGRRVSLGVVPDWHGRWPLAAHPDYCRLVQEGSDELLLHGHRHRRQRGSGPVTWLAEGSDEMNGLDEEETRQALERGQRVFAEVFGEPARGFLAPAWQRGRVRPASAHATGLEHSLGFFSLESWTGRSVRLATWTWDCGRWGWLGHVGHGIGRLLHSLGGRVPSLAIHPRDLARGFWPRILRLVQELLDAGYEPSTPSGLIRRAMLKSLFDAVMERRAREQMEQVGAWLPAVGPVLDVGSGTGHLAARLERELGLEVVAADVTDMHVVGRPPVLIADGVLPFDDATFSAALLLFMLHYPTDPAGVLAEAARVTRGPIILVQSLHASRLGYAWLRLREFLWTYVAFHVSRSIGYVSSDARFTMAARRFYTDAALGRDLAAAGLRVRSRRERPVLPGRSLVMAALVLERDA